jgi:hypothetical protein
MLAAAALTALLASLLVPDAARDGLGVWRAAFPWFVAAAASEWLGRRRRTGDGEAFLIGASAALLHSGVYAKTLQHGLFLLGVDALGSLECAFDGGMAFVLARHASASLRARAIAAAAPVEGLVLGGLSAFVAASALTIYLVMTSTGMYRSDRLLGPTWLAVDLAFVAAAAWLARRAWQRTELDEEPGREAWLWALCAFAVWLPGARLLGRAAVGLGLPGFFAMLFAAAWALAAGWGARLAWREGQFAAEPASRSRAALGIAAWRIVAGLFLLYWLGPDDDRADGLRGVFIDLPARAAFAWLFLTSRLKA